MEYVDAFLKFVEIYGVHQAVIFSLIAALGYLLWINSKSSNRTIAAIEQVSTNMFLISKMANSPYLGIEESLTIFREFADNLVYKLLKETENVIEKNNLASRKVEIKKNLTAQFKNIVLEKSEQLSKFHSKAGDLGQILEEMIDWEKMMKESFSALFSKHSDKEKVRDIKSILAERLNEIIKTIERRASAN